LRADVREALLALGVRPRDSASLADPASSTDPGSPTGTASLPRARAFVNDLYTWELRRMRDALLRGEFPKREYAGRVEALRRQRYWVLSVPVAQWCEENGRTDAAEHI
jgi:hypothetical protein